MTSDQLTNVLPSLDTQSNESNKNITLPTNNPLLFMSKQPKATVHLHTELICSIYRISVVTSNNFIDLDTKQYHDFKCKNEALRFTIKLKKSIQEMMHRILHNDSEILVEALVVIE